MQPLTQSDPGDGENKPHQGVQRADLPQNIEAHGRIIPDIPAQPSVYETACEKFNAGYSSGTEKTFPKKGDVGCGNQIHETKAYPAAEQHTPVGAPAPDDLQQTVAHSAQNKNQKILNKYHSRSKLFTILLSP